MTDNAERPGDGTLSGTDSIQPEAVLVNAFQRRQLAVEHMRYNFTQLVDELDLAELAIPMDGRGLPHAEAFKQFRLLAFQGVGDQGASLEQKVWVEPPEGADVWMTYAMDGKIYLDTGRAIVLVKADRAIAVAAASVDPSGRMVVSQIQAITSVDKEKDPEGYRETGLEDGIWWQGTMVNLWEAVARRIGCNSIVIKSFLNSSWPEVKGYKGHGGRPEAYDGVAAKLPGFTERSVLGDWVKRL